MTLDLDKLNSLTKYPSIPTYHALGEKGRIDPESAPQVDFTGMEMIVTEKVDGTNGRLVVTESGDWFIGSREEWLTARGDRIPNPANFIVATLIDTVSYLARTGLTTQPGHIAVFYLEVYGARLGGNAKQYSTETRGARLFDAAMIPLDGLHLPREEISAWRDRGGQPFMTESSLQATATTLGVQMTPRLKPEAIPQRPADVKAWLQKHYSVSCCPLDSTAQGASEGVVVRTSDRSRIAKIRFDDYRRVP